MNIAFTDFWPKFNPQNNFFFRALREIYSRVQVVHPSKCDVLFFSVFGREHQKYDSCHKVGFTGENILADTLLAFADKSLSFCPDSENNRRLPLWYMYIDWFGIGTYDDPNWLIPVNELGHENRFSSSNRERFCAAVFSNPVSNRVRAIETIRALRDVDVFGRGSEYLPSGELAKIEKLSNYRFSLCFENAKNGGYVTEKFLHARVAGTIPVYWGSDMVHQDFNTQMAIIFDGNFEMMVDQMLDLDSRYDEAAFLPVFNNTPRMSDILKIIKEVMP